MALVSVERRGGTAVITYANPPLGTMTAPGSAEMLVAVDAASVDPAVRAIVLTGGLPDIFIRHYDIGELNVMGQRLAPGAPPAARQPEAVAKPGGTFGELVDAIAAAPKPAAPHFAIGRVAMTLGGNELLKAAVQAGAGLGCISRAAVALELERGQLCEIQASWLSMRRVLSVVTHIRKAPEPALLALLALCRQTADPALASNFV